MTFWTDRWTDRRTDSRTDRMMRIGGLVLVAAAVLFTVLCVIALATGGPEHRDTDELLVRYDKTFRPDKDGRKEPGDKKPTSPAKNSKKTPSPQDKLVELICKKHVFSPDPPKKTYKITGVLGDLVFFSGNDKGVKVGETHNGAKIKQIGPDWVEVEVEGKTRKLHVFGEGEGGPSSPTPGAGMRPSRRGPRPGRGARGPRKMPPLTPEMIERFKSMPPEMQKKALEHMPPEFREKLEKAL